MDDIENHVLVFLERSVYEGPAPPIVRLFGAWMRTRKYEIADRLEKKTWEIEQQGASLTTKFSARKGNPPRVVRHDFESEAEAKQRFGRLVAEREEQGYSLTFSEDEGGLSAALLAEARRFEGAIVAAPDAVDGYAAYAEWLTAHEDPLGELVTVQLSLKKKPRDTALLAKQRDLLERHSSTWLGLLAGEEGFDAEWRWGFLEVVELGTEERCALDPADALRSLFALPTACFLRELSLGDFGTDQDPTEDFAPVLEAMVKGPLPKTLRRLVIDPKRTRLSSIEMGEMGPLLAQLRHLEELSVRAAVVDLGKIDLPELVRFKLMTRATKAVVRSVVTARWPKLSHLVLGFGKTAGGATLADLAPIFEGTTVPQLTHLGLRGLPFADEVVAKLRSSKLLPRLRSLDLSRGSLTRTGADMLIEMRKSLSHIEDLELSGSALPRVVVAALIKAFGDRLTIDEGSDESDDDDDEISDDESFDDQVEPE